VSLAHASADHFLQPNPREKAGMGFSLDYDIVKAHGGDVKVEPGRNKDVVYYPVASMNRVCRGVASNRYCNNGF
jgi:hypothetical protein